MPITILDYVKSVVGEKPLYTAEDFYANNVAMLGGCERCDATLGGYNAYPSISGFWRCADCIGDTGYATVEAFKTTLHVINCPACGETGNISENRITTSETAEEYVLECGECGEVWPL